jgi:hypothetical protein
VNTFNQLAMKVFMFRLSLFGIGKNYLIPSSLQYFVSECACNRFTLLETEI